MIQHGTPSPPQPPSPAEDPAKPRRRAPSRDPDGQAAGLIDLLDALESTVVNGRRVPLTRSVMLDEDEALEYLDRARLVIPDDIKRAHQILETRRELLGRAEEAARTLHEQSAAAADAIVRDAREEGQRLVDSAAEHGRGLVGDAELEAERIVHAAQEHAEQLVASHAVTRAAEDRAQAIEAEARRRADDAREQADAFARKLLGGCEDRLDKAQSTLRKAIDALGQPPSR